LAPKNVHKIGILGSGGTSTVSTPIFEIRHGLSGCIGLGKNGGSYSKFS
jgi:hypothetical protein